MADDDAFDGFDHDSLPSVDLDFSLKNSVAANDPECVVDIQNDGQWIRLPITRGETRVNKDGVADIAATSRVDLPVTWGTFPGTSEKIPIYDYVGAANKEENAEFDVARVYYWNQYTEEYQIKQFGYVASVGPSPQNGVFRFYIYDPSDLMDGLTITKTYDQPNARFVANFVAYDDQFGLVSNSPIPVNQVTTTVPGNTVENAGFFETTRKDVSGWINENVPIVNPPQESEDTLLEGGFLSDEWLDDTLNTGGHKHFRRNKHTLANVMDWLTEEIGGAWYFVPEDDGVSLVINNGVIESRAIGRSSYYDGQFDPEEFDHISGVNAAPIDVISNTSLEDLKPINHLELNGEAADSFFGVNTDRNILDGPLGAPRGQTNQYPHVEVRYPPLLERTSGAELGPPPIEVGKTTLGEAEQDAKKKFLEAHEDSTEGSVDIRSLPSIRPYDYISAVPVCNDTFDADMDPIQYEVNGVVHTSAGGEPYITSLGVSLAIDETELDISASWEKVNPNE